MKIFKTPIIFMLFALTLVVSCSKDISSDKLVTKNGVVFQERSSKPYTGSTTYLREDGTIKESGSFTDGYREGVWETYHQNGRYQGTDNYVRGVLQGPYESFYNNGQLRSDGHYLDGKLQGPVSRFDRDGTPTERTSYLDGVRNGPYEWYWDTFGRGNLRLRGNHKDGIADGLWEGYSPSGELWFKGEYKKGEIVGSFEEYGMGELRQMCCGCEINNSLEQTILFCDLDPKTRLGDIASQWYSERNPD